MHQKKKSPRQNPSQQGRATTHRQETEQNLGVDRTKGGAAHSTPSPTPTPVEPDEEEPILGPGNGEPAKTTGKCTWQRSEKEEEEADKEGSEAPEQRSETEEEEADKEGSEAPDKHESTRHPHHTDWRSEHDVRCKKSSWWRQGWSSPEGARWD